MKPIKRDLVFSPELYEMLDNFEDRMHKVIHEQRLRLEDDILFLKKSKNGTKNKNH